MLIAEIFDYAIVISFGCIWGFFVIDAALLELFWRKNNDRAKRAEGRVGTGPKRELGRNGVEVHSRGAGDDNLCPDSKRIYGWVSRR